MSAAAGAFEFGSVDHFGDLGAGINEGVFGPQGESKTRLSQEELAAAGDGLIAKLRMHDMFGTTGVFGDAADSVVGDFVSEVVSSVGQVLKQAFKMAVFKFALEACALCIKSLVEAMTGMNLQPPNIDTKGVYYNFNGQQQQQPPAAQPSSGPSGSGRYENPFQSPFPGSSVW